MTFSRSSIRLHSFQGTFALLAKGRVCNPCLRNELLPISQEGQSKLSLLVDSAITAQRSSFNCGPPADPPRRKLRARCMAGRSACARVPIARLRRIACPQQRWSCPRAGCARHISTLPNRDDQACPRRRQLSPKAAEMPGYGAPEWRQSQVQSRWPRGYRIRRRAGLSHRAGQEATRLERLKRCRHSANCWRCRTNYGR